MTAILLEPGLRRITAPNPSPMTLHGTNTFLVGERDIAVIDPGPEIGSHLQAILAEIGPDQRISHILVTHSHLDHSPLARSLSDATGAPVLAAGTSEWGRSLAMQKLAAAGGIGGGEGVDPNFEPDQHISDGDVIAGDGWQLEVLHTPGHMANHLSFAWKDALFSGDLVMEWATSLISPPDGDLTAFRHSLRRLIQRQDRLFYPAHGDAVTDPGKRCQDLLDHRADREMQILNALHGAPATPTELTTRIYTDIDARLMPIAERNVLAHLIDLVERNMVSPSPELATTARFHII
ncbi:MBL fold metallo-hydrolase [Nioella aestuarii]|uniref:MBL fold metallo-hydrolase n=1 Tax=Nioella aestuarii TaxID=1662864 RepID=UPI003D7F8C89